MFGFGKKKPGPALCNSNPGVGAEGKVAFSNGARSWTEHFNVAQLAATALAGLNHSVTDRKTWLEHPGSGYLLTPQLVDLQPLDGGAVQTVTTMQVNHPELAPHGLFEYQHSMGPSVAESITKGFDLWAKTDFVPLLEAQRPQPESCTFLQMEFPAKDGKPAMVRRAILGPVAHFQEEPPPAEATEQEEHPFCPCCLLTRSFEAFKDLFESDAFYGLRFFAAREPDGTPQADCRINGDDWEPGAVALRSYASTWPAAGYEFRKQFVVLHSIAAGQVSSGATIPGG